MGSLGQAKKLMHVLQSCDYDLDVTAKGLICLQQLVAGQRSTKNEVSGARGHSMPPPHTNAI
jgi:hypothetical protein